MRLIDDFDAEFEDCVAYFKFHAADSGGGFEFTLVRAKARPLVGGVRPTLIPQTDWGLPPGDPRRNVFDVVHGPATEDITDQANSGDGTTHIRLPSLGAGIILPIWIQIKLIGNISFRGDNTTQNWDPILRDGAGNPKDPNFISYYVFENIDDAVTADRIHLRYDSVPDSHVGHFGLSTNSRKRHSKPSGSSIHNPPPG